MNKADEIQEMINKIDSVIEEKKKEHVELENEIVDLEEKRDQLAFQCEELV
jgi:uncharacterized coiled-coil DUF342 family protein